MLLQNKFNIPDRIIWLILWMCALPFLLNLFGVNFAFVDKQIDLNIYKRLIEFENQQDLQDVLAGRYLHIIFVSFSIAIAFLTITLAFIDFRIKGEISTPIVAIALFCSGIFDTFHILVSTNLLHVPNQQVYIISFTWFFCRLFHALVLILGVSVFLIKLKSFDNDSIRKSRKYIFFISLFFVLFTFITIAVLFLDTDIPQFVFPYRNIARPYDLLPLGLYLFAALYILPRFYDKYPSVFSQTLILSMIPAVAAQLYMAFGSDELFDNNFNVSHIMTAFTYFIPFIGLSLNYVQTHKNEQKVIGDLYVENQERKRIEEALSGVLNSSLSSILAFKAIRTNANVIADFECTLLNPSAQLLFGSDFDKLKGGKLLEIYPQVKKEKWTELFASVIETNEPINYEYFSEYFQKWLLISAVKIEDGLAVTINDISKRKNALEELMSAEKLAVTGRIARTIAHEVRNPLTNINLSIEHLQTDPKDETDLYFGIIKKNSERINQLITELLNSSRQSELRLVPTPINKLLDETLELAIDRLKLKNIKLVKNYNPVDTELNLDVEKIKTALLNIIINSIEAMEENTGLLTLSTTIKNHTCVIQVSDNGSGIEADNIKNLFEPFFSKKKQGMGLGLTTTQNIILAHRGTIDVASETGKGTTFSIGFGLSQ